MNQQSTTASPTNGASTPQELFILTDEQILEIEPEGERNVAQGDSPAASSVGQKNDRGAAGTRYNNDEAASSTEHGPGTTGHESPVASHGSPEPPPWLAAQMKDPWNGEEATQFWNSAQQARQEADVYRAAFATPEDARALKELYPGGVNEARTTAQRARILDDIDRAYFGAPGNSPEQLSAARAQLAATMLREDPAAFREMVFAGLRALEEAEKGSASAASASNLPRLAQVFAANRPDAHSAVGATLGSPATNLADLSTGGPRPAPGVTHGPLAASPNEQHLSAYAAFEKAANEDLERSVGAAIERTLQQALPNLQGRSDSTSAGARQGVPLQDRLTAAVRQDVEAALQGDGQLGEQIAQILSARRFDNETRAQVVRLIDDRARQLVPSAAKRVINDWTQATLAAHRGNTTRTDAASTRREVKPASSDSGRASLAANSQRSAQTRQSTDVNRGATRHDSRRVDYRKLSDEQILEL